MILWRPSRNNQRYAFTPLLDNSEDENEDEDDEIFNSSQAGVYEMIKQRSTLNTNTSCMEGEDENGDGGGGKASVAIEIANKVASDKIQVCFCIFVTWWRSEVGQWLSVIWLIP